MTNISRYLVNVSLLLPHITPRTQKHRDGASFLLRCLSSCAQHLLTFSLQDGDVQGVEEAQARLSFLAENKKLWSQQMFLDVGAEAIYLRDIQSQVRTRA